MDRVLGIGIGIGLATKNVKLLNRMPGWASFRAPWWGYHSDDGKLYSYKGSNSVKEKYKPFAYSNTVGCAVDFKESKMFYTLNRQPLGKFSKQLNKSRSY